MEDSKVSGTETKQFTTETATVQPPRTFARSLESSGENKQKCFYCGYLGHVKNECRRFLKLCLICGSAEHQISQCPDRRVLSRPGAKGNQVDNSLQRYNPIDIPAGRENSHNSRSMYNNGNRSRQESHPRQHSRPRQRSRPRHRSHSRHQSCSGEQPRREQPMPEMQRNVDPPRNHGRTRSGN